jgi:hypothetical protein
MRDTYFLYLMLNLHNEWVLKPDVGCHKTRHIEGVLNNPHTGGAISVGGLVTRLVYKLKVLDESPIYRVKSDEEIPLLNMRYLKSAGLIKQTSETYYNLSFHKDQVPLPLPPLDSTNPPTWLAIAPPPPPQAAFPTEPYP